MKKTAAGVLLAFIVIPLVAGAEGIETSVVPEQVPRGKQTAAQLYLTSTDAHRLLEKSAEDIKLVDVRTVQEYVFVGHAERAYNVPYLFATRNWDAAAHRYAMEPNNLFVEQIKQIAAPDETVLLMCRSGGRSAAAANMLKQAGYDNVYSVVDGFEGDSVRDRASKHLGKREVNGWRNSDLPWTYRLDPRLAYQPHPDG